MSITIMNLVWQLDAREVSSTERLVLLNLASYANGNGTNAFPSVQRIARQTSLTRRGVQKALRRLCEKRLIVADGLVGRVVRYTVDLEGEPRSHYESNEGEPRSQSGPVEGEVNREPDSHQGEQCSRPPANDVRVDSEPRSPDPSVIRQVETSLEEHRGVAAALAASQEEPIGEEAKLKADAKLKAETWEYVRTKVYGGR